MSDPEPVSITTSRRRVPAGRRDRSALGVVAVAAAITLSATVLLRGAPEARDPLSLGYGVVASIAYLVPGVVLLWRRRWHVVGWLLCAISVGMAVTFAGDWGAVWFGGPWMIWLLSTFAGALFWLPFTALLVVFPDGLGARPARQRRWGRALVAVSATMTVLEVLAADVGPPGARSPSPLGAVAVVPTSLLQDGRATLVSGVALLLAFVGLVVRYRSSHAAARRQYRWVLWAILVLIVTVALAIVAGLVTGVEDGGWWGGPLVAYLALPIAFMVAILRYHLYEIDRIVARTVTYTVVVTALALVYLAAVGLLTQVLPADNDAAIAASTLAVAALFRPLQRRVHHSVQRAFNRPRFDAEQELQQFTVGLRGRTDLRAVERDLTDAVDRTMQPATLTLWLRRS